MLKTLRRSQIRRRRFGATAPSPRRKLLCVSAVLALSCLIMPIVAAGPQSSIAMQNQLDSGGGDLINSQTFSLDSIAMTEDGFMLKTSGQTASVDRSELSDIAYYTVEAGDTLSTIARAFSVSVETIIWENNIANPNSLKTGTRLAILPVSGITHTTSEKDTLASIAAKYKLDLEKLAKQNGLTTESQLVAGAKVIIPGGKKAISTTAQSYIARAPASGTVASFAPRAIDGAVIVSNAHENKSGKWMIRPTQGVYTTTFGGRAGHWGVDIADSGKPDILAAADGTVLRSQCGWNGGYGCMIVVDHGDGIQTLYGHLSKLYVGVGDSVSQGNAIGKMGNTGRVFGKTGIHLHFEVVDNGIKKNPLAYYNE